MGSGDIRDISIVTIVGIDIVRICGFYVIVDDQLLLSYYCEHHWPCYHQLSGWTQIENSQYVDIVPVMSLTSRMKFSIFSPDLLVSQLDIDCYKNCQCNFPLVASGNNGEGRKLYFVRENESEDRIAPTCSWETEGGRSREFPFLNWAYIGHIFVFVKNLATAHLSVIYWHWSVTGAPSVSVSRMLDPRDRIIMCEKLN